jgi:hypothetical protein
LINNLLENKIKFMPELVKDNNSSGISYWWSVPKEELVNILDVNMQSGLTKAQIEDNRKRFGTNTVEEIKPAGIGRLVIEGIRQPMMVLLFSIAGISEVVPVDVFQAGILAHRYQPAAEIIIGDGYITGYIAGYLVILVNVDSGCFGLTIIYNLFHAVAITVIYKGCDNIAALGDGYGAVFHVPGNALAATLVHVAIGIVVVANAIKRPYGMGFVGGVVAIACAVPRHDIACFIIGIALCIIL